MERQAAINQIIKNYLKQTERYHLDKATELEPGNSQQERGKVMVESCVAWEAEWAIGEEKH